MLYYKPIIVMYTLVSFWNNVLQQIFDINGSKLLIYSHFLNFVEPGDRFLGNFLAWHY
jgi:hypothetical protein